MAGTGAGLALLDGIGTGWFRLARPQELRWMSPRGTLDVMDDYPLWVAKQLGYFHLNGLDVELLPGAQDPDVTMHRLAAGAADIGFPAPAALFDAVDRGLPLVSIFQVFPTQVFSLAVPPLSPITRPAQVAGKTIAVGSLGWRKIIDPMLVDAGVDPRRVRYVDGGPAWSRLLKGGRADAALVWEGLRSDWTARGISFRPLSWERWSRLPSNSYAVRRRDLEDPVRRDLLTRFLRAAVMGLEFARQNPRAAAQITFRSRPAIASQLTPQRALNWMLEIAKGYGSTAAQGLAWGLHHEDRWHRFATAWTNLGQTKPIAADRVFTNRLVALVNGVDMRRIRADALAFEVDGAFRRARVPSPTGL